MAGQYEQPALWGWARSWPTNGSSPVVESLFPPKVSSQASSTRKAKAVRNDLMNSYGRRVYDHWKANAPHRLRELENPTEFFTELGERLQQQISDARQRLEATLDPNLTYLQRAGQMQAIRKQAEELILSDYLVTDPPEGEELLEELKADLPSAIDVRYRLSEIRDRIEDAREMGDQDYEMVWQERIEVLERLEQALTRPEPTTPQALTDRIHELTSIRHELDDSYL